MKIYDTIKDKDFKVILEAGGNTGTDTMMLCNMFSDAKIHTFEPIKLLADHIQSFGKPNLSVYQMALSDFDGTTDFYVDMNPYGLFGASSMLQAEPDYLQNYIHNEEKITVPCITLESFCKLRKIKKVDFLWLDIEMLEYKVLNASKNILNKIGSIYLEISYSKFRQGQCTYEEIDSLLVGSGFKQVFIEPQGSEKFDWQANAYYAR